MEGEGSSKEKTPEKEKEAPTTPAKASEEVMTPRKRERKNEDDAPEDSDDEDNRAEIGGSRNFPAPLWNRLKNPPNNRPTIDVWEFKMEGECCIMTFVCDGEKYPMYFTTRSNIDYQMRANYWIPRHNMMYKALRTRLYSIPKNTTINKLLFFNTPDCDAEDCLTELMFIKKWTCKQLEYNLQSEFNQPQHLRKLVHMFKPTDITVNLIFGPYVQNQSSHDPGMMHNHLSANYDTTVTLEKDYRVDCQHALNGDSGKNDLPMLYGEAGKGKAFGSSMLRTLCALRKFVSMMMDRKMAQTKGMTVRKFIVNGPSGDKICSKLQQLFKEEGSDEANKKRAQYATGEKIYICVRNDLRRAYKYSLAMPASQFKMDIGNEQLLGFVKNISIFHCLFRTNIDAHGVVKLIEEWQKGDRNFDDIQVQIDKVIEPTFADHLGADHQDQKRIKFRRVINNRRHTMYVDKDRLGTRHLSIRVAEGK